MRPELNGPIKSGYTPRSASVEVALVEDCVAIAASGSRTTTIGLPPNGTAAHLRPTELVLSALGGCILTNVIIFCREQGVNWQDLRIVLRNTDQLSPPRIASILVEIRLGRMGGELAERLFHYVRQNSRMYNTLSADVPVSLALSGSVAPTTTEMPT